MNEGRRADDALLPQVLESLNGMSARMARLEGQLAENTKRTNEVYEDTRDVVKIVNQGRGFFAVCDWVAGRIKMISLTLGLVAGVCIGIYEYVKTRWLK